MTFYTAKLRVKELAEALGTDISDVISICSLLGIPANSPLTSLTIEQCKKVVDYYEEKTID
tara:strand:- start:228 stop:410 length:183 start_codon:yes stop_codon:yes gene_type:complete